MNVHLKWKTRNYNHLFTQNEVSSLDLVPCRGARVVPPVSKTV
ncbi:hypothetical protein Hdeb2414_s0001g00034871 [Helianthus debilis subsp. tardiflorus]